MTSLSLSLSLCLVFSLSLSPSLSSGPCHQLRTTGRIAPSHSSRKSYLNIRQQARVTLAPKEEPRKITKQVSHANAMHKQSLNLSRQARVTLAPKKISRPDSVHTQTIPDPLSKVSQQESPSTSQHTPAPKKEPRPNKAANDSNSPRKRHEARVTENPCRQARATKQESRRTRVAKQSHQTRVTPKCIPQIRYTSIARQESHPRKSLTHIQAQGNHNPSPSKSHQARVTPNPCRQAKPPNKSHATHYHDRCLSLTL